MTKNERFGIWCSLPGLLAVVILIAYPILHNLIVSFLSYNNVSPIRFVGLSNYKWFFNNPDSALSLKVSAIFSLGATTLAFLIALILAHSLNRIGKFRGLLRTLLILPWVAPLVVSGLVWRWIFDGDIGVLNYILTSSGLIEQNIKFLSERNFAMVAGIVTTSWCYIPFMLVLILSGLESIPYPIYEAATIDGANNIQKFWRISLPLNRPQMIITYMIVLMFTFRTPDTFFSLTGGGPAKATYHSGIFLMETIYRYLNFGHAASISMIILIICFSFALPVLYFGIIGRKKK